MDLSDAVDRVRAHHAQVAHVDTLHAVLLDERHASHAVRIARKLLLHILQVSEVNLVDDLQMSGQHGAETVHGPAFDGLGQQSVVGVGACALRDSPCVFPVEALLVQQDSH